MLAMTTTSHAAAPDSTITSWLRGRLPEAWTAAPADDHHRSGRDHDRAHRRRPELGDDASDADRAEAVAGRISGFREDTREARIQVAREAEHRFDRKVAWGVRIGERTERFTHLAVPVMTRLRQPERMVLDTLVAANVARSRADALAWCVRLVGQHTGDWLSELRDAMQAVERLRAEGPDTA